MGKSEWDDEPDDDQFLRLQDPLYRMPQPTPQDVPQMMWPDKVGPPDPILGPLQEMAMLKSNPIECGFD
jgi:hypothetical protein